MPNDESPAMLLERLIAKLTEIERGPLSTLAAQNALRHARACEDWLALHQERRAELARWEAEKAKR